MRRISSLRMLFSDSSMNQAMLSGLSLAIAMVFLSGCGGESHDKKLRDARALDDKARTLFYERQYPEAMTVVRKAMYANAELQQDSALTENHLLVGLIQRQLGQYDSTLMTLRYVLERAHLMTNPVIERKGKIALADFLTSMRSYTDAVSLATDAATSSKFSSDWESLRASLFIASTANHGLGHYESEVKSLRELFRVDAQWFGGGQAISVFERLMSAFAAARQPDSARAVYEEWMRLARLKSDTLSVARAHLQWGSYEQSMHQYDSSFHAFSKALDLLNVCPDLLSQRQLFSSLGNLAFQQRNFDNAKRYYNDALGLIHKEQNRPLEMIVNLQLVACDLHLNGVDKKQILDDLKEKCTAVKDTCEHLDFREGEALALFFLGRIAERRNEPAVAFASYEEAMALYEQNLLSDGESDPARSVALLLECEQTDWYEAPLQMQCAVENIDSAFELVERRNLQEAVRFFSQLKLTTAHEAVNRAIADVQWKRSGLSLLEKSITEELTEGKRQSLDQLHILQDSYPAKLNELSDAENELDAVSPTFQWLLHLRQPKLKEIQSKLSANAALVEFVPLASTLCVIVVKRDSVAMRRISANRQYLYSLVNEYNSLISDAKLNSEVSSFNKAAALNRTNKLSQMLYTLLIEPIHPLVAKISGNSSLRGKLYVVVPGEFGYLPLHTLRTFENNRLMTVVQKFNVSYLPSAAVLLFPAVTEKVVHDVVGVGCAGTTSWDVEYELKDVRAFYDKAKMLFDTSATLENLAHLQYDLLQMTAEFSLDTSRPGNSYVVLSDGATLTGVKEVPFGKMLAVPAPQALLFSNISSVAGGFFRYAPFALLANGTQSVIATMWQGERKSKKYFGEVFYTNLQLGSSASAAYQQAMIALSNRGEFSQVDRSGLYYQFGR